MEVSIYLFIDAETALFARKREMQPRHIDEHGESVAGGAFRRYDPDTAEFKRIWTHSAHRRRGS